MTRVIVLGGHGQFGCSALEQLWILGISSIVAARGGMADIEVDADDPASIRAAFSAGDLVIDAAGPFHERSLALLEAAVGRAGIAKVIAALASPYRDRRPTQRAQNAPKIAQEKLQRHSLGYEVSTLVVLPTSGAEAPGPLDHTAPKPTTLPRAGTAWGDGG
ncbi:MAG: hypothetical protein HY288_15305 [Planctomycetia bacterium]|nr:hypothetical protein [Planctomycetia bacterium]